MDQLAQARLGDLLDREIEVANSLAATLDDEKLALTGTSPAAIEETAGEKVRLFKMMETLEKERRGLCADPTSTEVAPQVTARWHSLISVVARCRNANELNGYIIRTRQHQIRQLIDIVRGKPAAVTYDPQGKTFAKALRALARA